jgi:hypothetical protein
MDISERDRDLITRTVLAEAGSNASPAVVAAITHVILNRQKLGSKGGYADDVAGVLRQPNAFEPWSHPEAANYPLRFTPKSTAYQTVAPTVAAAIDGEYPDPTGGYTHFLQPNITSKRVQAGTLPKWPGWAGNGGMQIGQHTFYPEPGNPRVAAAAGGGEDDPLIQKYFGKPEPAAAPSTAGTDDDPLIQKYFGGATATPTGGKAVFQEEGEPRATPEVREEAAKAVTLGRGRWAHLAESIPVLGPAGEAAAKQLGFGHGVNVMQEAARLFAETHPGEAAIDSLAGAVVGSGPLMATAPGRIALGMSGPLGARVYSGAAGGGILNSIDAWLRGQPVAPAAGVGAIGGAAGPALGEGARGLTGLISDYAWPRPGPLGQLNRTALNTLTQQMEGETGASLAQAQGRIGKPGFFGELSQGLTDLTGAIGDSPGVGKGIVREAYRQRSAAQGQRLEAALDSAMGNKVDIVSYKNMIEENRAAAADPLYRQWHSMPVQPTPELKALIPRMEKAGAFDAAEELAGISGKPFTKNYFTTGQTKNYPTAEGWDLAKQGLDRKIDAAYRAGDNRLAKTLIQLKGQLIDEIGKTPAGQVWNQARSEFADRSALLDHIDRGYETFAGGRKSMTVDELREELKHLSQPEMAARLVGARNYASETMRATAMGDTTLRNSMLTENSKDKLRLMLGDANANQFIASLESEKNIAAKAKEVVGGSPTESKQQRSKLLEPPPLPQYSPKVNEPFSLIPPHLREELRPSNILMRGREASYANAKAQLAPLLTSPAEHAAPILDLLTGELRRRAKAAGVGSATSKAITALIGGTAAPTMRRRGVEVPSLDDLVTSAQ